jgi:uncharacterized protein (DUF305 family)
MKSFHFKGQRKLQSVMGGGAWRSGLVTASTLAGLFSLPVPPVSAQQAEQQQTDRGTPVVVQPGAPGQPTRTLPPSTRATLPPRSSADVQFMQGMIMHHAQAVEMTALIPSHTDNKDLQLLGARISKSQSDEIQFMKRWLAARGEPLSPAMPEMPAMDMSQHQMLMPGMLTEKQMEALKKGQGAEFDQLFLIGMIQHHNGALIMVKDLFDTAGSGQDAELFTFTTDVDSGQRAEIRIMQSMLEPFKIAITAENSTVVAGGEVSINVSLTNTSNHAVYQGVIYKDGIELDTSFRFEVRDEDGKLVPKRIYPYEELRTGKVIFRTIRAGETLTQLQPVSRLYDMRKPGKYTVQVSRGVSDNPKDDIKSNIVTVTVTPNSNVPARKSGAVNKRPELFFITEVSSPHGDNEKTTV